MGSPDNREFVDVDGIRTAYYELGSGPAVLLLHGGDPQSSSNASDWAGYAEILARWFHVIALDKLGQGYTGNPSDPRGHTMSAVCAHVATFVDTLGLAEFAVIGHSRGALPAAQLALDAPDRVFGLVVYDSNTLGPADPSVPSDFYDRIYAGVPDRPDLAYTIREPILNSYSFQHVGGDYLETRLAVARLPERRDARAAMASSYRDVFVPDAERVRERVLARVANGEQRVDVLLVWGREDPSAPLPVGLRLFESYQVAAGPHRTEFQLVERAGHYPYREHPEACAERVRQFLTVSESGK